MEFQLSYFSLKDDAVKVLHSVCQRIWKTQQWPQDWKRSIFIPISKKGNAKECSNYCTIALISHASNVMLKILQARLQQYVNHELPDVQGGRQKRQRKMGIPHHLTFLPRNMYAGPKAKVRTGYGTTDWFPIGKGVCHGCILSPCLFNLYAEYIMRNAGLDEEHAGIKIAGRIINNFRYADDTTLKAENEEELKSLLMKMKAESKKLGLQLNIQKTKIMASRPIISWQIDGETMETVTDFIFLHSQITADDGCSHEIKRRLLLGRKAVTNLDTILKGRDITLPTKVHLVKAMVFPVVMYKCKS